MFYLKAREAHFQGKQMFFQTRRAKTIVFAETRQGIKSFYRKTKTFLLIVYIIKRVSY